MDEKVAIKVTLHREIWLSKETWESFGEQLPIDDDDLEMLEGEALMYNTQFKSAEVVDIFTTGECEDE
jgi:hypothetical protein